MTRLFTAVLASAAFLFVAGPSFADTAQAVAVASPSAMPAMKGMATPPSSKSTTKKCPAGESYVKGYTKADGTKVKGYCRKSAS